VPEPVLEPLTEDAISAWRARLTAAREIIRPLIQEGRTNVARYRVKTLANKPVEPTVVVPLDYAYVEQKKAQLFNETPEVLVEAGQPEAEPVVPLMKAIANEALGSDGVNLDATIFEAMPDLLLVGYAATKIGHEAFVDGTRPVTVGQEPDPGAQPGAVLGLSPPMKDIVAEAPNIVHQDYYWRRFPPGYLAGPADFLGSDWDDAPWIAMRFSEDLPDGATDQATKGDDTEWLLSESATSSAVSKALKRWGWEVWIKAARFDPTVTHPERIRTFKLYDDEPIARDYRDSPFQRWLPNGRYLGMKGYPIEVLTLRYQSDTPLPTSDAQVTRQTSDEISTGRTQVLRRRDRSLPNVLYDTTRVTDPAILQKIERNENTGFIGVPGNPNEMFLALDKGQFGRENFAFNDQAMQDMDRAWALGSNAGVIKAPGKETATKTQQVQAGIDTRLQSDRARVLKFVIKGVTKLMALKQLFADQDEYVNVVGQNGAAQLVAWNKTQIPWRFLFKAKPDSHIRLDAAQDREQTLRAYNLLRKDPSINPEVLIRAVALKLGFDPQRLYVAPQPPKPEPPKINLSLSDEGLTNPLVLEILTQLGLQIKPETVQMAIAMQGMGMLPRTSQGDVKGDKGSSEHGGASERTEPINQHGADITGGTPGIGVM
jgi:hypothetical protein